MDNKIKEGSEERLTIIIKKIINNLDAEGYTPRDVFNISQSLFVTVAYNILRPEFYDLIFENMREKLNNEKNRHDKEANND